MKRQQRTRYEGGVEHCTYNGIKQEVRQGAMRKYFDNINNETEGNYVYIWLPLGRAYQRTMP